MPQETPFLFVICQKGATAALRKEILEAKPELKLAYSCPGFVTFKDEGKHLAEKFSLPSTLARTYGWNLEKTASENALELIDEILEMELVKTVDHIHVFEREKYSPGEKGFEPGVSLLASEVATQFEAHLGNRDDLKARQIRVNAEAKPDDKILDVILVEPNEWWIGYHYASTRPQRWVGGVPRFDDSKEVISRAYFKLAEALKWTGFKIAPAETCIEIGSAPGGACQLLLERGHPVIAIDPADLDESIADHPHLTHFKKRGRDVRKKDLKSGRWLFADLNVAPDNVLDTVEEIVNSQHTNIRGMILTMKMSDWTLIEQVPSYLQRVRQMGFGVAKARQLSFNRQEFCLAAARDRFDIRSRRQSQAIAPPRKASDSGASSPGASRAAKEAPSQGVRDE